MFDGVKERYSIEAWTSNFDAGRRWFLNFDVPSNVMCRVLGHRLHVVELSSGMSYEECSQCYRRPPDFRRNSQSHVETSQRYADRFSLQFSVGNARSETPIDGHLIIPGWRGFYFGTDIIGYFFAHTKTARRAVRGSKNEYDTEVFGVDIDKHAVHWQLGAEKNSWKSGTPKWKDGSWNFYDTVFGKPRYVRVVLDTIVDEVHLPERAYSAVFQVIHETWSRRFKRKSVHVNVKVNVPSSIPTGPTSWYGLVEFDVPFEKSGGWLMNARREATEKVLRERERYAGSRYWMPPDDAY